MKRTFIALLLLSIIHILQAQAPVPGDWILTFEDEFEGEQLDPLKWRMAGHVLHFNGMASNDSRNIQLKNGNLEIIAEKRSSVFKGETYPYASGEITSFRLFRQAYGYFEARIRYDAVRGSWPAFWTMPDRGIRGPSDRMKEIYIKFSLDTTGGPVESAFLRLKVKSISSSNDSYLTVHRSLSNNWTENNLSWNTKPLYDPVWIQQLTGTTDNEKINDMSPGDFIEINVTAEVNRAIEENSELGFCLLDRYMRNIEVVLHSKEAENEADRPHLLVGGDTVFPSADSYVCGGQYAGSSYGDATVLEAYDPWANTSSTYDGAMETDIMETLGIWGDNYNQHALHWDGYGDDHKSTGSGKLSIPPTEDGFHTYGMYWEPGKIEFYTDGIKTWEYENSRVSTVPGFLILSHQLGGWDGNASIADELFPAVMEVDYVRVYEDAAGVSVNLTSPAADELIEPGSELKLSLNTLEYSGIIDKVVFKRNGEQLGEDLSHPYAYSYTENERGRIHLLAMALDQEGQVMDADSVTVISGTYPEIELASPADGTVFTAPGNFDFWVQAQSEGGRVDSVCFFINEERIAILTEAPFKLEVDSLFPGSYSLFATVINDLGLRSLTDTVRIEIEGMEISAPWTVNNIGAPVFPGKASYYQDVFLLEGAGEGSADTDKFIYVYQALLGDCEITARLQGIQAGTGISRAGLMIRESLEVDDKAALLSVDETLRRVFAYRTSEGGVLFGRTDLPTNEFPCWLKLLREDNYFSGYISQDSLEWEQVLELTKFIGMNDTVLIGMVVSSGMEELMASASFDAVSVRGTRIDTTFTTHETKESVQLNPEIYVKQLPGSYEVYISHTESGGLKGEVLIYDFQGRLRYRANIEENPSTISLHELNMGMYILVFQNSEWRVSRKMVF